MVSAAVDELVRIMLPAFLFFSLLFSTGGSDSSVSDGLPMHIIYAAEGLKIVSTIAILNKKLQEKSSKDKWLQWHANENNLLDSRFRHNGFTK